MQIESPECQVAQAKINAYLSGTDLPEEAVKELEDHLAVCPDCQKVFAKHKEQFSSSQAEQSEPAEDTAEEAPARPTIFDLPDDPPGAEPNYLSAIPEPSSVVEDTFSQEIEQANKILEQPEEVPAFIQPADSAAEAAPAQEKKSRPKFAFSFPKFSLPFGKKANAVSTESEEESQDEPAATPPGKNKKLIYLSVSLFIVLAAMSFLSADPTRLFGKRASETKKTAAVEQKNDQSKAEEKSETKKTEVASETKSEEKPTEEAEGEEAPVVSRESHEPDPLPLAGQHEGQAASLASDELARSLAEQEPDDSVAETKEPAIEKHTEVAKKETPVESPKIREAPALASKSTKKIDTSALEAEFKKYSAAVHKRSTPSPRRKTSTRRITSSRRSTTHRNPTTKASVRKSTPKRAATSAKKAPEKSHVTVYGPDGKPLK